MITDDQVRQLVNRMMGSYDNPETVLELMGVEFGEDKKLEGLFTLEQLDLFYGLLRVCDWCEQWRGVSDLNEQGVCSFCSSVEGELTRFNTGPTVNSMEAL